LQENVVELLHPEKPSLTAKQTRSISLSSAPVDELSSPPRLSLDRVVEPIKDILLPAGRLVRWILAAYPGAGDSSVVLSLGSSA
jgi:hypothetical protein